jgi:hypothetical protein
MVTKRTFAAIAEKFRLSKPYVPEGADADALTTQEYRARCAKAVQWNNDVVVIADAFATENPRFDRRRFYLACGVD